MATVGCVDLIPCKRWNRRHTVDVVLRDRERPTRFIAKVCHSNYEKITLILCTTALKHQSNGWMCCAFDENKIASDVMCGAVCDECLVFFLMKNSHRGPIWGPTARRFLISSDSSKLTNALLPEWRRRRRITTKTVDHVGFYYFKLTK